MLPKIHQRLPEFNSDESACLMMSAKPSQAATTLSAAARAAAGAAAGAALGCPPMFALVLLIHFLLGGTSFFFLLSVFSTFLLVFFVARLKRNLEKDRRKELLGTTENYNSNLLSLLSFSSFCIHQKLKVHQNHLNNQILNFCLLVLGCLRTFERAKA